MKKYFFTLAFLSSVILPSFSTKAPTEYEIYVNSFLNQKIMEIYPLTVAINESGFVQNEAFFGILIRVSEIRNFIEQVRNKYPNLNIKFHSESMKNLIEGVSEYLDKDVVDVNGGVKKEIQNEVFSLAIKVRRPSVKVKERVDCTTVNSQEDASQDYNESPSGTPVPDLRRSESRSSMNSPIELLKRVFSFENFINRKK